MYRHTRSYRRWKMEHLKRKVLHYYTGYMQTLPEKARARHVGMTAVTRQHCSCYACGNPRKYFRSVTRQEIQAAEAFRQEMEEYGASTTTKAARPKKLW